MELDLRRQQILQAVVQDYVATAERGKFPRSRGAVQSGRQIRDDPERNGRNERARLSAPAAYVGRSRAVGSGLRFYVNRLMPLPVIQEGEASRMRAAVESASSEMESILRRTCQILADDARSSGHRDAAGCRRHPASPGIRHTGGNGQGAGGSSFFDRTHGKPTSECPAVGAPTPCFWQTP